MENKYDHLINWLTPIKNHFRLYSDTNEYKEIMSLTNFLSETYDKISSSQRLWHLINGFEIPKCKICGGVVTFRKNNAGFYSKVCSIECQKKYQKTDEYNNKIDKKLASTKRKKTLLERYGDENYVNVSKIKDTKLERYGDENYVNYEKGEKTRLKLYGNKNYLKTEEFKEKSKETCIEKYGVDNYAKTEEQKEKSKETCIEKYGVSHPMQRKDIKEKANKTCIEKYGVENYYQSEEFKEKLIEKYGIENISEIQEFKDKRKLTFLERYGVDNYAKTDKFKKLTFLGFEKELIESGYYEKGYKIISIFNDSLYEIYCPNCKKNFIINKKNTYYWRIYNNQEICTNCNPLKKSWSNKEKDISNYIMSIYHGKIIENDITVLKPKELDIYLPDLGLAIEYNGLIWHSNLFCLDNLHELKTNICLNKNIRLIHVFEDDWINKQEIIKSILQTSINPLLNYKLYARKCVIKEVNLHDTNDFLNNNHINGKVLNQSLCYGLYNKENGELMSLMSFRKNKDHYDLQRYAIKLNYTIIGGAEKLFHHFINNVDYNYIITYADRSLFSGKIYDKLGFEFVRTNKPNFMFVDTNLNIRISKQSIRGKQINYKRENDIMPRIYNSGINVYKYKKDD